MKKSGIVWNNKYFLFGASLKGAVKEFVFKVKLTFMKKSVSRYGKFKEDYFLNILLKLLFANKQKFYSAKRNYENKKLLILVAIYL